MAEDSRAIVTEADDAIAVIRFNRPLERNPLSLETLHHLETAFLELTLRSDVRAIIFTGTDDVFASGANIRELEQLDSTSARNFSRLGQRIFQLIEDAKPVTIAAINGYCIGGALDLALACDIRVASRNAVFAHPGPRLGIITGWGGTQRLSIAIGRTRALQMFVTGRSIDSAEALVIGLVAVVGDPALEYARTTAAQLLQIGSRQT